MCKTSRYSERVLLRARVEAVHCEPGPNRMYFSAYLSEPGSGISGGFFHTCKQRLGMSGNVLFSDLFRIESLDPGKYDRVTRIEAQSTTNAGLQLTLDINTELYQVQQGETVTVAIASSLGETNPSRSWRPPRAGEASLADNYEYVMHGKVYKFTESDKNSKDRLAMYASFGGLLLSLEGSYKDLVSLKQEQIYLLIRR